MHSFAAATCCLLLLSANHSDAFQSVAFAPSTTMTTTSRGQPAFLSSSSSSSSSSARLEARSAFNNKNNYRNSDSSRLYFFFGNKDGDVDTKNKELAFFPKLSTTNGDADVKFESLSGFILSWSKKFEDDRKGMGLTTPVKVTPTLEARDEEYANKDAVEAAGVRIIFQATKTGYKSKTEESDKTGGGGGDGGSGGSSGKKNKGPPMEGGVEIRVEKLSNGEVQLTARRCDTDEDTMVKEMSEEAIVSQLKQAVDAWKKL